MLGLGEGAARVQGAHIMPTEQVLYSPDSYLRYMGPHRLCADAVSLETL